MSAVITVGCVSGDTGARSQTAAVATVRPVPLESTRQGLSPPPRNWHDGRDDDTLSFDELQDRYADASVLDRQSGQATYYGDSLTGNHTANGEIYDPRRPTMAHRTLPFGTVVRITRLSNRAAVIVRVTDRGPFGNGRRIADLSKQAARRLDMIRVGVVDILLEVLKTGDASKRWKVRRGGAIGRR